MHYTQKDVWNYLNKRCKEAERKATRIRLEKNIVQSRFEAIAQELNLLADKHNPVSDRLTLEGVDVEYMVEKHIHYHPSSMLLDNLGDIMYMFGLHYDLRKFASNSSDPIAHGIKDLLARMYSRYLTDSTINVWEGIGIDTFNEIVQDKLMDRPWQYHRFLKLHDDEVLLRLGLVRK